MANKEMETFSYSVSHDLRNPLGVVDGYSEALLTAYGDKLDQKGRDCLQRVRAVTAQMAQLIDDLLQFSIALRAELRRDAVDLSALAETVVAELRQMDPGRQVTIAVVPGLTAAGDRGLLRVVLRNLLGNAWKFTRTQPQPRIDLGAAQQDGTLAYFVRDNGVGFDMARADKLFGAFQRLHDPREFPGTGVGLATVQRIVQRHGGRVWAEAAVGKGATFYFTL
jgi:light-regulated signal transduction histidine kinase (bacteriophytochrome)